MRDAGLISRSEDDYYGKPDGTVWHIKPLQYTLGLGIPGLLLLGVSMCLHLLIASYGNPFINGNGQDYSGAVRLAAMLLGGILLIIAWPIKRHPDWTPAAQAEVERERQRYHEKKFGNRD